MAKEQKTGSSTPKKPKIPVLEPKPIDQRPASDPVDDALKASFPASDPPAHGKPEPVSKETGAPASEPANKPKARGVWDRRPDRVQEASEESFPASDPPAWGTSHA